METIISEEQWEHRTILTSRYSAHLIRVHIVPLVESYSHTPLRRWALLKSFADVSQVDTDVARVNTDTTCVKAGTAWVVAAPCILHKYAI